MKMKLRKSVLFFLSVTVLAPIVLYTDTLGGYFTSLSLRDEFVEEVSTLTFTGEVGPLNVLPQESSAELKEPMGVVYSDDSTQYSSNHFDASSGENAHNTRQLTGELVEDRTTNSSSLGSRGSKNQSLNENPLKQVTDTVHEAEVADESSNATGLVDGDAGSNVKKQFISENSVEPKDQPQSSRTSGKDIARQKVKGRIEKQNEQRVFLDVQVREFKDKLVQAKVYLSLSATRNNLRFVRELSRPETGVGRHRRCSQIYIQKQQASEVQNSETSFFIHNAEYYSVRYNSNTNVLQRKCKTKHINILTDAAEKHKLKSDKQQSSSPAPELILLLFF